MRAFGITPTFDLRRTAALVLATALLLTAAPFNVGPAHAAVAGTASVTNPAATVFRGSSGNSFAFTVTNTSTASERIAAVFITGPTTGNPWIATACSAPTPNWIQVVTSSPNPNGCYYETGGGNRLNAGETLSGFGVTATAAAGATDVTAAWGVHVSPNTDGTGFVQASAASAGSLNSTIKVFEVLSAVVADASATIDSACPAASTSAPEDSFKVIVICGKNRGNAALSPTSAASSLGGTFIQTAGTLASGSIAASSASSRVLANYTSTRIATSAGSGKTVIVTIGAASATSPSTTLSGYTATADTTAPNTTIEGGTADGVTITTADTATYTFSATETGSTFTCSMSTGADSFSACSSPKNYSSLAAGTYTFKVKATDPAGNTDATPASRNVIVSNSDTTAPSVSSITASSPTNSSSVTYTVTFSEPVTTVAAGDFVLTTTGVTGAAISAVTGSGATRTVTLNTGSGSGTMRLDVDDDDGSIEDAAGNDLNPATFTSGTVVTVDKTTPSVSSITRKAGLANPTNASSLIYTVTFSESVTGVGAADFALTTTGGASGSIAGVSGSGDTREVTVSSLTGNGTVRLDLNDADGSIRDGADNGLSPATFTSGQTFTVDHSAPSVSSVTAATPTNASSIDFTIAFSEVVTPLVSQDLVLTTSGVTASITNVVQGLGNTWVVTVSTGSGSGTIRLDVDDADGTIEDAAGNALSPTTFTSGTTVTVDKDAPSVTSITRSSTNPTDAASVDFTVTFSEPVTPVTTSDFTLITSGVSGAAITGISGSGTTRTLSVTTGSGSGTIRLDLADVDASIEDAAGNDLSSTTFTSGESYTIDKGSPSVSSITAPSPTGAGTVTFTVTFSEPVVTVTASDFVLTTTGVTGAAVNSVASSGATRTVTVDTGSGSGTIRLDVNDPDGTIKDVAGNPLSPSTFTSGTVVTVDKGDPSVTSITRKAGLANPTNASTLIYTVTFSEPVGPVATGDFTLTTTGIATGTISSVSGSGATRDVTVSSVTGTGTVRLDLADGNGSIVDAVGNPLSPATFTTGDTFTVDRNAPAVSSITRKSGLTDPTNASTVTYTVTFSESVAPVAVADFALTTTGTASGTIFSVTGSGATRDVTVSSVTGTGTVRLDFADDNASVTDAVGSAVSPSTFTTGQVFTIDNTAPVVTLVAPGDGTTTTDRRPTLTGTGTVGDPGTITIDLYVGTSIPTDGTLPERTLTATRDPATGEYSVRVSASPQLSNNTTYTAQAYQTDAVGNVGASSANTFTVDSSFTDTTGPIIGYTFPAAGGAYNAAGYTAGCGTGGGDVCGTASDATGVGTVEISILRTADGTYWNGSAFSGTTQVFNPATGTTFWSYAIAAANLTDGSYTLTVRATDRASAQNVSTSTRSFTIDTVAPSVTLSAPGNGTMSTDTTPTFSGIASIADPASITVKVYTGSSIPTDGTVPLQTLSATRDPVTGSFSVDAAALADTASYTAEAYQTDGAGNVGASGATTFTIDPEPPPGGGGGGGGGGVGGGSDPTPSPSASPTGSPSPTESPSVSPSPSISPSPSVTPPPSDVVALVDPNTRHLSPNGDGDRDTFRARLGFSAPVDWVFTISSPRRRVFEATGSGTEGQIRWDGRAPNGRLVRDGTFRWSLEGVDADGLVLSPLRGKVHVDTVAPVLRRVRVEPQEYEGTGPVVISLSVFERVDVRVIVERTGTLERVFDFADRVRKGRIEVRWRERALKGLEPGRYLVTVRILDRARNKTSEEMRFIVLE